jgi:magnesium-transporting ATPase (P-type)
MKTSCTKRSVDSNSERIFSESNRASKDSSSRSSSKSSDSDSNGLPLGSYDLVIFVGGDAEDQMLATEAPSTTPSVSNRNVDSHVVGVVVIGLGLVIAVALFSYWRKRNDNVMSEQSRLISHNEYKFPTYI